MYWIEHEGSSKEYSFPLLHGHHQREMEPELQKRWDRHLHLGDTSSIDNASDDKVIASIGT